MLSRRDREMRWEEGLFVFPFLSFQLFLSLLLLHNIDRQVGSSPFSSIVSLSQEHLSEQDDLCFMCLCFSSLWVGERSFLSAHRLVCCVCLFSPLLFLSTFTCPVFFFCLCTMRSSPSHSFLAYLTIAFHFPACRDLSTLSLLSQSLKLIVCCLDTQYKMEMRRGMPSYVVLLDTDLDGYSTWQGRATSCSSLLPTCSMNSNILPSVKCHTYVDHVMECVVLHRMTISLIVIA